MSFGGSGGGGSGSISTSTDVFLSSPATNQVLTYDGSTLKWKNAATTADQISETSTNKIMTAAERTKLSGVAVGATANDTDANLRNRANHTGTQAISTVTTLQTELNSREIVVRWSGSAWGARPAGASFGVVFLSTNDAAAPNPPTTGLQVGDIWRRHPDAA